MNHKQLICFTFLVLILGHSQLSAQKIAVENTDEKSKKDEAEVTKFADSFLDSFIENKDLNKIPTDFFEEKFKSRFADYADCAASDKLIPVQDRYKASIASQNFTNLLLIIVSSNFDEQKKSDFEEFSYENSLPPNIFDKIKKSKWLNAVLGDEDGKDYSEPQTSAQITELFEEMSTVSGEMALYLQNHPVKTSQNFLKLKEDNFKYYPAKICEGESCMGLPEKTPIFSVHEFMMCLRIAKINNQWKVVQVYSVACED